MNRKHVLSAAALSGGPMSEGPFSCLPAQALHQLAVAHKAQDYPMGATLFREGEPANGIYLLCNGGVKLSIGSTHGDTLLLRSAGPGEILGLSATLTGQGHEVTAETTCSSQLAFIPAKDFLRYLREHGEVCIRVVQCLSNDVHAAYNRVRVLGMARLRHNHNNHN